MANKSMEIIIQIIIAEKKQEKYGPEDSLIWTKEVDDAATVWSSHTHPFLIHITVPIESHGGHAKKKRHFVGHVAEGYIIP